MPPLSPALNKEFQLICKEVYGKELSYEEAEEAGTNITRYFSLLMKLDRRHKGKQ